MRATVQTVILISLTAWRAHADVTAYAASYLGGANHQSSFGTLDLNTGAFTPIAALNNTYFNDLAMSDGTIYALTVPFGPGPGEFGTISPTTGAITNIAPNTAQLQTLAFSGSGTLYGISYTGGTEGLYTINPATGAATLVANLSGPIASTASNLRFIGNTGYTTSYVTPSSLYTINLSSGAGTLIGPTGLDQNNTLGAFVNGQLVGMVVSGGGGQLYTADPATGNITLGATSTNLYVFTTAEFETTSTVPALPGWGLGILGMLLAAAAGWMLRPAPAQS